MWQISHVSFQCLHFFDPVLHWWNICRSSLQCGPIIHGVRIYLMPSLFPLTADLRPPASMHIYLRKIENRAKDTVVRELLYLISFVKAKFYMTYCIYFIFYEIYSYCLHYLKGKWGSWIPIKTESCLWYKRQNEVIQLYTIEVPINRQDSLVVLRLHILCQNIRQVGTICFQENTTLLIRCRPIMPIIPCALPRVPACVASLLKPDCLL